MPKTVPILWDILEEHLDEAEFLSRQWERALIAPGITIQEVANGPETRLRNHIYGITVAAKEMVERFLPDAISDNDIGKVFASALAILDSMEPKALDLICDYLGSDPKVDIALVRALQLTSRKGVEQALLKIVNNRESARIGPALEVLASRQIPVAPEILWPLLSKDSAIKTAAIQAARLDGGRIGNVIDHAIGSSIPVVRNAALKTALLLGYRTVIPACRRLAEERAPECGFALLVLALGGELADVKRIEHALEDKALRADALVALGYSGYRCAVEACLRYLDFKKVGRLAGESFSAITGLVIEDQYLREEEEREEPIPFEEEDLDEDLSGPETDLPLPESKQVLEWWSKAKDGFKNDVRYLNGKPLSPEVLLEAFQRGPCRRRHALGLELAVRSCGEYSIETSTWARKQLRIQKEQRLVARSGFLAPFDKTLRV